MFYLDLFRTLRDHEVRYALVGGLAMNLHGVPRMTMDVDILVDPSPENLARLIATARALQLRPGVPVELDALLDPGQRARWIEEKNMIAFPLVRAGDPASCLDVLIAPPLDPVAIIARAETRVAGGVPVALASIEDMIALKRAAGRAQDRADLEHLERIMGRDP
jgi:hypothetical protein